MKSAIGIIFLLGCAAIISAQNATNNSNNNLTDAEIQRIIAEYKTKEANKQLVKAFYQGAFGDKDSSAIDRYIDNTTYIQHNPTVADGADALKKAHATWFQPGAPKTTVDFQNIGADGDFVYLHIKNKNGDNLQSLVDIFKVKNGKIVEHWDTMQDVPKDLKAANDHPFF